MPCTYPLKAHAEQAWDLFAASLAKKILTENANILYGIFSVIKLTEYFPPREFLNQFLEKGTDPCDQDGRMGDWAPFVLDEIAYEKIRSWWLASYPKVKVDALGAEDWQDWVAEILDME